MIETIKQTTTVEFANSEKGAIVVRVNANVLTLHELSKDKDINIGEFATVKDIKNLPKIEMYFHKEESVDVMIKQLEKIKFHLKYPHGCLALAC